MELFWTGRRIHQEVQRGGGEGAQPGGSDGNATTSGEVDGWKRDNVW